MSILNTWRGESWSSCQTIKSVLLTLMTILNDTPLLNEPGYSKEDVDFDSYNDILTFKNIDLAIIKILNDKISPDICLKFQMNIHGNFMKNYSEILEIVRAHKFDQSVVSTRVYNMKVDIDYKRLELNLITLYSKLSKIYE